MEEANKRIAKEVVKRAKKEIKKQLKKGNKIIYLDFRSLDKCNKTIK
jgi:hypothetical protein